MFVPPIFHFWFLVTFGDKVLKIRKYYVICVYVLQGKMGKTWRREKRKENHGTKVTKIPKKKIWDDQIKSLCYWEEGKTNWNSLSSNSFVANTPL